MELRDLIVTPILLVILYSVAYAIRPYVTDHITRRYFILGLTVRIVGALSVGFIYQFYYSGGDTYNFHTYGSRVIWEAFVDSPEKAFKLLFNSGSDFIGIYDYVANIDFWNDSSSFMIVRLSFLLDLITFSSYSATAVLFATLSFLGMWMFFLTFYKQYPDLHGGLAFAALFIPSVFFWGAGLLKDTVTLACLGIATYQVHSIFMERKFKISKFLTLAVSLYLVYAIKIYILLAFMPSVILWIFLSQLDNMKSTMLRVLLFPVTLSLAVVLGYFATVKASEDNPKYAIDKIAQTSRIVAYDIRYWSGRDAGSGYSLGELDGTFGSMIRLAPSAITVSLFRPWLWEIRNPLMLLSALESFIILIIVLYLIFRQHIYLIRALQNPNIIFLLIFSIVFAFSVGISTYNFGTLARYKIPLLPFFATATILMLYHSNKRRKLAEFEITE